MRAVIGEDHALLRDGLERILQAHDIEVVASVADAPSLARALREHRPDVSIVDVRMPPTLTDEGLRVALEIRREHPGTPIVVLSQYVENLYARELLDDGDGSIGYLLKDRVSDIGGFVTSVRQVAAGGTVIDPEVVRALLARHDDHGPLGRLTAREREVLDRMAQGRSNAAIAAELVVTQKAIDKHVGAIFAKLALPVSADDNRRVLAVLAYLNG